MVKISILLDFHFPSDYLLAPQARKKLRKSMNLLDFITADKNQSEKNSVKSEKNSRKTEKTSRILAKNSKGGSLRLLKIAPKTLKKRA